MLFLTGGNYNQKRLVEKGNKIILLPKGKEFNDRRFKYDIFVYRLFRYYGRLK